MNRGSVDVGGRGHERALKLAKHGVSGSHERRHIGSKQNK